MPDCVLCGPVSPGTCAGTARPCVPAARPMLTAAEYAAKLPFRLQKITDEMNDRLADVLPEGMRFEWAVEPT